MGQESLRGMDLRSDKLWSSSTHFFPGNMFCVRKVDYTSFCCFRAIITGIYTTELGILQIAYLCEWIPDFTKASKRISVELGVKYIEGRGRIAGWVCISRAMNAPHRLKQANCIDTLLCSYPCLITSGWGDWRCIFRIACLVISYFHTLP